MRRILIILTLLLIPASIIMALPKPQGFVSDYMGLLDAQSRAQITEAVEAIEKSTGAEIAIVIQSSLPADSSIEELALAYLSGWKVGKPGKDNGLILLIINDEAKKYHGYRFETGRGLEGDLPDGLLGQIGREEMVPYFRANDYGNGILSAIVRIGGILGADLSAKAPKKLNKKLPGIGILIFIAIIFLLMMGGRGRGGGVGSNLLMMMLLGQALGGRRGGFGGGGFGSGGFGGSSGGFGGFGGGGGGSGGGATGSW